MVIVARVEGRRRRRGSATGASGNTGDEMTRRSEDAEAPQPGATGNSGEEEGVTQRPRNRRKWYTGDEDDEEEGENVEAHNQAMVTVARRKAKTPAPQPGASGSGEEEEDAEAHNRRKW